MFRLIAQLKKKKPWFLRAKVKPKAWTPSSALTSICPTRPCPRDSRFMNQQPNSHSVSLSNCTACTWAAFALRSLATYARHVQQGECHRVYCGWLKSLPTGMMPRAFSLPLSNTARWTCESFLMYSKRKKKKKRKKSTSLRRPLDNVDEM